MIAGFAPGLPSLQHNRGTLKLHREAVFSTGKWCSWLKWYSTNDPDFIVSKVFSNLCRCGPQVGSLRVLPARAVHQGLQVQVLARPQCRAQGRQNRCLLRQVLPDCPTLAVLATPQIAAPLAAASGGSSPLGFASQPSVGYPPLKMISLTSPLVTKRCPAAISYSALGMGK